jgi:glycosyltransferase involved in cell wall biosynthesis
MEKVSAYIIGFNEERNIENAIKSVLWADEVVLVDSFSTDRTVEIALSYGVRVVQIPFEGFGKLRNSAIASCSHDWVFSLDTDERCTQETAREVAQIVADPEAKDAYYLPRRNIFMGKWVQHSGWYPDYRQPQLFRKKALLFSDDLVHESYEVHGSIGYFKSYIWQIPYRNFSQMNAKTERYSTLGAGKLSARGKKPSMWNALSHGINAFARIYFFKKGFLDGWAGFVLAFSYFEVTFYKYAKQVELDQDWEHWEQRHGDTLH